MVSDGGDGTIDSKLDFEDDGAADVNVCGTSSWCSDVFFEPHKLLAMYLDDNRNDVIDVVEDGNGDIVDCVGVWDSLCKSTGTDNRSLQPVRHDKYTIDKYYNVPLELRWN